MKRDGIVPVAVKISSTKVDLGKLLVGYFFPGGIATTVQCRLDLQTGVGGCSSDQFDHDIVAHQRLAAPILGYVTKQPMFDFIPFTGSGRKVSDRHFQSDLIGKRLQDDLPQTRPGTVAATTVGGNQDFPGAGKSLGSHLS